MLTKEAVRNQLQEIVDEFIDSSRAEELSHLQPAGLRSALSREVSRQQLFARRFGPFFATSRVERELGVTRQAISKKVAQGQILRVTTRDGMLLYPAFQFVDGKVDPTITQLVGILRAGGMDEWSVLYWLTAEMPELEGRSPAQASLTPDPPQDTLMKIAEADSRHWVGTGQ